MHNGGAKSTVVVMKGSNAELAHYIAMQVASMAPTYVSSADLPKDVVEHETSIQTEIVKNDPKNASKPDAIIAKMVEGKVSKALKDMCLVDQEYFLDTNKKVAQVLKEANTSVVTFVRYEVGEGMEKRQENFAEEVAKQMGA